MLPPFSSKKVGLMSVRRCAGSRWRVTASWGSTQRPGKKNHSSESKTASKPRLMNRSQSSESPWRKRYNGHGTETSKMQMDELRYYEALKERVWIGRQICGDENVNMSDRPFWSCSFGDIESEALRNREHYNLGSWQTHTDHFEMFNLRAWSVARSRSVCRDLVTS